VGRKSFQPEEIIGFLRESALSWRLARSWSKTSVANAFVTTELRNEPGASLSPLFPRASRAEFNKTGNGWALGFTGLAISLEVGFIGPF
jgi:hypothetical protein